MVTSKGRRPKYVPALIFGVTYSKVRVPSSRFLTRAQKPTSKNRLPIMPKAAPTPFEVDGVECSIKDGLVNVGLNAGWPSGVRFPIKAGKATSLDDVKDKVRGHTKFAACKALVDGTADAAQQPPPVAERPALMREVAALALPPAPQLVARAEPATLLVRRSTESLVHDMWHEQNIVPIELPLNELPYTWFKPGLRRCADGFVYVLSNTFVRLPPKGARFVQRRCFHGKRGRRTSCFGKQPWTEDGKYGPACKRVLQRCSDAELVELESDQICLTCKCIRPIEDMRMCKCGSFFCDVHCQYHTACPHIEELNLAPELMAIHGNCGCTCCAERCASYLVSGNRQDGVELLVDGTRWTVAFDRHRKHLWCEEWGFGPGACANARWSKLPPAVKKCLMVLWPHISFRRHSMR